MKEFIVPIEDTDLMEVDLQHFLYDIALKCYAEPSELVGLEFFVPIFSFAKKQWIVYFGSEYEVNSIDPKKSYSMESIVNAKPGPYDNFAGGHDALMYDILADYVCDYWLEELRQYDEDDDDD